MTVKGPEDSGSDDANIEVSDDDPMAALLKRSLGAPLDTKQPSILVGVQKRIRKRSRGKFFADGWSTTDARISHALIALAMLLVLVVAYFALGPVGIQ
jgi:hypothetical protein